MCHEEKNNVSRGKITVPTEYQMLKSIYTLASSNIISYIHYDILITHSYYIILYYIILLYSIVLYCIIYFNGNNYCYMKIH